MLYSQGNKCKHLFECLVSRGHDDLEWPQTQTLGGWLQGIYGTWNE